MTSATRAGISTFKIRQQTGHASDAMLSRYVREGELFLGNAAGILLGAGIACWALAFRRLGEDLCPKMGVPMSSAQHISGRTGTSPKGGKRAYVGRLWKDRSACQNRHSISSANDSPPEVRVPRWACKLSPRANYHEGWEARILYSSLASI